jgi:Pyridoxamine 5'-phosphate oxidase
MADAEQVYRARPTAEEVADVLSRRVAAAVGTLNPDGTVHLAYVLFLHHDGRLYFETSSITRKARNAEAQELNHRLRTKYIKPAALEGVDRAWGRLDDVAVEITPKAWRSWTGSVLHEQTQQELTVAYEDAWLDDQ